MADDLPSEFDLIVIGTGLTESIISAAASRTGHTVLHIDEREYYGGQWATLNWDSWTSGIFAQSDRPFKNEDNSDSDLLWTNNVRNLDQIWYDDLEKEKDELKRLNRKFNIDISPRLLLTREELIDILIESNVSRYLEFKAVQKLLTSLPKPEDNVVEPIPLSRSDIFTSKSIGLGEKRNLMKFLESATKLENSKSFEDLSAEFKLSDKTKHMMRSAIRNLDGFDLTDKFSLKLRNFLNSIGRFENQTPYLWTLYGLGEICQSFCRLSAIYGGVFILRRYIESIELCENGITVKSEDKELKCKFLILGPETHLRGQQIKKPVNTFIRAVFITKGENGINFEIDESKKNENGILVFKIEDLEVIELNHSSCAVPKGYRLIHATCLHPNSNDSSFSGKNYIESKMNKFLEFSSENENANSKPKVIYASYFLTDFSETEFVTENPTFGRVFNCGCKSAEITSAIETAKSIFNQMYPDDEFLPRAPDAKESEEDKCEEENEVEENNEGLDQIEMSEKDHDKSVDRAQELSLENQIIQHEQESSPSPPPIDIELETNIAKTLVEEVEKAILE